MSIQTLGSLEKIRALNAFFPDTPAIKAWKSSGKKAIAFQCTYVPEEIIYAAGILPVRLIGDAGESGLTEADACMYPNTCSFIRRCLQMVLKKRYDFLDGFVAAATCDCSRRLMDVWEHHGFTPFTHIISAPRKMTESAYELYETEVRDFKSRLEDFTGERVTDEAIFQAIALYNRRRDLLRKLHELKKQTQPVLTGAETMELLNASASMPPEQFNPLLEGLLQELSHRKPVANVRFRLMVTGSPMNNPEFIKAVEDMGSVVVIDELCTGVRYWWEGVDAGPDPLKALCRRYLHNFPCPRMEPSEDRLRRILKLVRDYGVDGVISQIVHYCVPHAMEQPSLRMVLQEAGVPVLELDVEYGAMGTGQIRTRVQAFLEMLERRRE